MSAQAAQRLYYAARDRAGIAEDGGIHGLRHAFATLLPKPTPELQETLADFWRRVAARDIERCPDCQHGRLRGVAMLTPTRPSARGPPSDHG